MRAVALRLSAKALQAEGFRAHAETFASLTRLDAALTCAVGQLCAEELCSTGFERETLTGASARTDALFQDVIAFTLAQLQEAIISRNDSAAEEEILLALAELHPSLAEDLRSAGGNRGLIVQELLHAHGFDPTAPLQPIVPFAVVVEEQHEEELPPEPEYVPTPEPSRPPTPPLSPEERRDLVLTKVKEFGLLLRAVPEFCADREVVLAALSAVQGDSQTLMYAAPELRSDPEVVSLAIQRHGCALKHAAPHLHSNRDLVLQAVQQNGLALAYAEWDLRKDRDLVIAAIMQDGQALQYATWELKQDPDIVTIAVQQCGIALRFAAPELQDGKLALSWRVKNRATCHVDKLIARRKSSCKMARWRSQGE